jgi:hypothetical protein
MNFGTIDGMVSGTERIVFDYEVSGSAASSISTGDILNGNEDGWYTIIMRSIYTSGLTLLRFNGDTGANYGRKAINATDTTVSDSSATGATSIAVSPGTGGVGFFVARVYAKSGTARHVHFLDANGIGYSTATTVYSLNVGGGVWNNTTDNLVSMTFVAVSQDFQVGTRVIVLKSNNFTGGTPTGQITTPYIKGSWVRVGASVLSGTAATTVFSGLDGDRDVVYYISACIKASGNTAPGVQLNSLTTNGNQFLEAVSTGVTSRRTAPNNYFNFAYENAVLSGHLAYYNHVIFAKTGFARCCLTSGAIDINGATVTEALCAGNVCTDTSANVTSITCSANAGGSFDTGSQFDLYALRPGG